MRNLALIILLLSISGCATVPLGEFSIISTKDVLSQTGPLELVEKNAVGKDTVHMIVVVPTGQIKLDDAVADALSIYNGDVMKNVKARSYMLMIPPIYMRNEWRVEGEVWRYVETSVE